MLPRWRREVLDPVVWRNLSPVHIHEHAAEGSSCAAGAQDGDRAQASSTVVGCRRRFSSDGLITRGGSCHRRSSAPMNVQELFCYGLTSATTPPARTLKNLSDSSKPTVSFVRSNTMKLLSLTRRERTEPEGVIQSTLPPPCFKSRSSRARAIFLSEITILSLSGCNPNWLPNDSFPRRPLHNAPSKILAP